jgi:hypothetical protein
MDTDISSFHPYIFFLKKNTDLFRKTSMLQAPVKTHWTW